MTQPDLILASSPLMGWSLSSVEGMETGIGWIPLLKMLFMEPQREPITGAPSWRMMKNFSQLFFKVFWTCGSVLSIEANRLRVTYHCPPLFRAICLGYL